MCPWRSSTVRWTALAHDIQEGVRSQPGRVGLTFASITLGMAALVTLLAIVGGVRQRTRVMIGELGIDVFGIVQPPSTSDMAPRARLARRHVDYLAAQFPDSIVTGWRIYDGDTLGLAPGTLLAATDERLFRVRPWHIVQGRSLDPHDVRDGARRAVASTTLARALQLHVGGVVSIHNVPFDVVGIADIDTGALEAGGAHRAVAPGDRLLLVPWSAPACWSPEGDPPTEGLDAIFVKGNDPSRSDDLVRRAERLMDQPDYAVASLSWVTPRDLIRQLMQFQRLVILAGGAIVLLCLLMGGITLSSLLLAGLHARIPEIGLRRALGASPSDVGILFLCEALCVTLSASVVGAALAWGMIRSVAAWSPLPLRLGPEVVVVPILCGTALGIVFSYWPARSAARIAPSEALRNE